MFLQSEYLLKNTIAVSCMKVQGGRDTARGFSRKFSRGPTEKRPKNTEKTPKI